MTEDALQDAINLIKAGRIVDAKNILEPYIMANPHNIQAWLWEIEAKETIAGKIKIAEMCLQHNPDDPQVRKALSLLITRKEQQANSLQSVNRAKKKELVVQMTNIEIKISEAQENINTFDKQIEAANKSSSNAGLMILLGLFLAPVGIGIIIVIIAFIRIFTIPREIDQLEGKRNEWLAYLKKLRKQLVSLRGELAII